MTSCWRRRPVRAINSLTLDTSRLSAGRCVGDPLMMRRVAANLLDNAVAHAVTVVSVALFEAGDEVVLRVDDDGPGIAPADRQRAVERFVRLDELAHAPAAGLASGSPSCKRSSSRMVDHCG